MTYPKLYKRTVTGAIQVWWCEINPENPGQYRSVSGQVDGKMVEAEWRDGVPTNVGRSNERDSAAQVIFEIEAHYTKQQKLKYTQNIDLVDKTEFFQCMLAKDFTKDKKLFKGEEMYYSQPKLDGIRCIITSEGAFSRAGEVFITVPHILELFAPVFEKYPNAIFDGELYNHRFKDNFNEILSIIKRQKVTEEDIQKSRELAQYWVYDFVSDADYYDRMESYTNILDEFGLIGVHEPIQIIPSDIVRSVEHIMELYESYIEDGFEGQMIRRAKGGYETKRTSQLLKHKTFDDNEFRIVSIERGTGNRKNMAGYVVSALEDGRTFGAGIMGNFAFCTELLEEADEYVGGDVTIKHFKFTPDGIPRFPKAKALYKGKRLL
jgi:DNA ligase 1